MTGASGRRVACLAVLAAALTLAGCTSSPAGRQADRANGDCCVDSERYPPWLVTIAEPAAPLVGTSISLVSFRKGYLGRHDDAVSRVMASLRPLDILVLSSKGRLSGRMIPGLFGHAAIYLGTEAQLRAAGLWTHPDIVPHHDRIRAGALFIEADQKGIHLSPPARVLNTDRAALLRPTRMTAARRKEALTQFFGHLNSRFDFHFDNRTPERLYCAELIAHVMPETGLSSRPVYGRPVIVPDSIVEDAARGRAPLRLVLYVHAERDGWHDGHTRHLAEDLASHWAR